MGMVPSDVFLRVTTELRALARRSGLLTPIARLRSRVYSMLGKGGYEYAFDRALEQTIQPGDVVWDIGANIGTYTKKFSALAGATGCVWAVEPVPSCFSALTAAVSDCSNVRLFNIALGAENAELPLSVDDNALGTTHTLALETRAAATQTIVVPVWRGDELRTREGGQVPNVVKVDVEGFEEEVIKGLAGILSSSACRAVLIEIHFAILEQRGQRHAPTRIKNLLEVAGFDVNWSDQSHLVATRHP